MKTKMTLLIIGILLGYLMGAIDYFDCRECSEAYKEQAEFTQGIELWILDTNYRIYTWK